MDDLSLHVLDIVENSIAAGATEVDIQVREDVAGNILEIRIADNGKGMDAEELKRALDPFYTTKTVRKVGFGLSMLAQSAQEAGGGCDIESRPGEGTTITARFVYDHIDRKPLGDMGNTIAACIAGNGERLDLTYRHRKGDGEYFFDTREFRKVLEDVSIDHPEVLSFLKDEITDGLESIAERSKK